MKNHFSKLATLQSKRLYASLWIGHSESPIVISWSIPRLIWLTSQSGLYSSASRVRDRFPLDAVIFFWYSAIIKYSPVLSLCSLISIQCNPTISLSSRQKRHFNSRRCGTSTLPNWGCLGNFVTPFPLYVCAVLFTAVLVSLLVYLLSNT